MAVCSGIEYDNEDKTITVNFVDGDVKGDDSDSKYNYQDIYDTAQNGEWGVPTKAGNKFTFKDTRLVVTGNDTYFGDSDKNITFEGDSGHMHVADYENCPNVEHISCVFDADLYTFYPKLDFSDGSITKGCAFYHWYEVELRGIFSNVFSYDSTIITKGGDLIDSIVDRLSLSYNSNFKSVKIQYNNESSAIGANIKHNVEEDITLENINVSECETHVSVGIGRDKSFTIGFLDSQLDFNKYSYNIYSGEGGNITWENKTLFKAHIENGSGGELIVYDKNNDQIYSENLTSDYMTDQEILYEKLYLEATDGELTAEELIDYEPFTLKVSKPGLQDLEIPNIYATVLQEDGSRVGTLSPTVVEGEMRKPIYINHAIEGIIETTEIEGEVESTKVDGEVKHTSL